MQSKYLLFLLLFSLPILAFADCETALEKNNYYITLDPAIDSNRVTFNLKVHNCGNEQISLPKLRPSGSQKPKYLYVWTFGDHTAPIRTEEPTYTHIYPNANCNYVAKVELTSVKSSDDELSIISYPSTIDIVEFGIEREPEDVNLLGSKWIFVDISRIPRPNQEVTYFVTFQNELSKPVSGQIVFKYPKAYLYDYPKNNISCEIDADGVCINEPFEDLKNHQITYEFDDLKPNIQKTIPITFKVKNTVAQRTVLGCYASMYINETGQGHTACNTRKAVSSWDPNKKVVDMPSICTTEDTTLTYTIHFENEGSGIAENVVLEDMIPPTLDIETIEVIEESHLVGKPKIDLAKRKVRWDFNAINLPGNKQEGYKHNFEASRGFVSYRIKIKNPETLSTGTEISASAGITFQGQKTISTPPAVTERFCFETDCAAEAQNTSKGFIKSVSIDNTTYETEAEGFGDHSSYEFKLLRDSTYQLIIKSHILPDGFNEDAYYKVWIDYNQNGEFEEGENILTDTSKVEVFNDYVKEWDRSFGGEGWDIIRNIFQTSNGDFFLVGYSNSSVNEDKFEDKEDANFNSWVIATNEDGLKKWNKSFGNFYHSSFLIEEINNNEYLLATSHVSVDSAWRVSIFDNQGNIELQNTTVNLGIIPTTLYATMSNDNGYIIGGTTPYNIGDIYSGNSGNSGNFKIIKLNESTLSIEWTKILKDDSADNELTSLQQTNDQGYILGGTSDSGSSIENKSFSEEDFYGGSDYRLIKLNSNYEIVWDKVFGGNDTDYLSFVKETTDGGYIIGGTSFSGISGNKTTPNYGMSDIWVLKLDEYGDTLWTKSYGGSGMDYLSSILQAPDGGFLLGGTFNMVVDSDSFLNNSEDFEEGDYWFIKIDTLGNIEWDIVFGGVSFESGSVIDFTNDGGVILGGISNSLPSNSKTAIYKGGFDYWLVKLTPIGGTATPESIVQITFTLPSNAQLGRTGMRIASQFNATPNNCGTYTFGEVEEYTINILETNPDLLFEEVVLVDTTVTVGENAELDYTVRNEGNVAVNGNFEVKYYLSSDALFTSDDVLLGDNTLNTLAVGDSQNIDNASLPIPNNIEAGIYYVLLLADADSIHQEINEANNLNYQKINLISPPNTPADLAIENPFLMPATVVQEDSAQVTYTLKNYGGTAASPIIRYYLSADETLSTGTDVLLTTPDNWNSLESGGSSCHNKSLAIPTNSTLGNQYILVVVDNVEDNNSNNQISLAIEIEDQAPDLKIVANSLTLSPNPVAIGGEITICGTIENTGGGTGSHSYITYTLDIVSCETEDGVDLNYKELIADLGEGASTTFCSSFDLLDNLESGSYYVQVKADGLDFVNELTASSQAGENNNVETVEVTIEGAVADLTIHSESLNTDSVAAGESINLLYEAENLQAKSAAAHYVKYYLVADTTDFSSEQLSGDVFLGHRYLAELAGSSSDLVNHPFITIPDNTAFGDWYLAWVIDGNGTISEASEANNFAFEAIKVVPPLVDECEQELSIFNSSFPQSVVFQTAQNVSVSQVFDENSNAKVRAGQSVIITDSDIQGVFEASIEECACPDLIITDVDFTGVSTPNSSTFLHYQFTVQNIGSMPAYLLGPTDADFDNISIQNFFSVDTIFLNNGDIAGGGGIITFFNPSPPVYLLPNESFTTNYATNITNLDTDETPYLTMKIDWGSQLEECDEDNNTYYMLFNESGANKNRFTFTTQTPNDFQFRLYPNPANNECFFHFQIPESGDMRLTVLDAVGKVYFQEEKYQESGLWVQNFDLYDLPLGVYFVQVEMGGVMEVERLVVVR